MIKAVITSGDSKNVAKVTSNGELVVSQLSLNDSYYQSLTIANTVYNLIEPRAGYSFVIDGIAISGSKDVNNTDGAAVSIYAADSATEALSSENIIIPFSVTRLSRSNATGMRLRTPSTKFINAVTSSAVVELVILGYYVKD